MRRKLKLAFDELEKELLVIPPVLQVELYMLVR